MHQMRRLWLPTLGLLSTAAGVPVVGLLALLVVLARAVPGRSWLRRALYAFPALLALLVTLLAFSSVLEWRLSAAQLLAAMLVLSCWPALRRGSDAARLPVLAGADAWVLLLGGGVTALLARPLVGKSLAGVASLLSSTTDGATHAQMVLATERAGGFIHLAGLPGLSEGVEDYPGAWSGMVWWLGSIVTGGPPDGPGAVRWVAAASVGSFLLLTAFGGLLVHQLIEDRQPAAPHVSLVTTVALAAVLLGPALLLMQTQSYPLLLSLALVLAAGAVQVERHRAAAGYVVTLSCALGIAHSWYLLAPAALVLLALAAWQARAAWRWLVPLTLALTPVAVYPLATGPRPSSQLSMPGSTLLPTFAGILALIALTAMGAVWLSRGSVPCREPATRLLVVLVTLLTLLVALVVRRGMSADGLSYYAAKVLTVTVLIGALASVSWLGLRAGSAPLKASLVVGLLVLGLVSVWAQVRPAWQPAADGYVDSATVAALLKRYPHGPPPTTEVLVADGCSRVEDLIATKWLYDLTLSWTPRRGAWLPEHAFQEGEDLSVLAGLIAEPAVHRVELLQHRPCLAEEIRQLAADPKVTVVRVS